MTRLLAIILLVLGGARAAAAESPDLRSLLEQAAAAYNEGAGLLSTDSDAARDAFRKSASLYSEAAAAFSDGPPAPLMYNLANASFLAGDHGRAVLWYKRAERLSPNDESLRANLATAREKIGAPARRNDSLLDQLTILEFVPAPVRFWLAAGAFSLAWTLALWRLLGTGWKPGRLAVAAGFAVAALSALSLVPRELRLREPAEAVVLTETTARAGPDAAAYEPAPSTPLKPGTELRIIEHRASWLLAELPDATRTWIESSALEPVARNLQSQPF